MLPLMPDDDCDALHLLLVGSYKPNMIFKCRNILPPVESGCINQQFYFAMLTDEGIELRRNLTKVVGFQFLRRHDFQGVGSDNFCLDHEITSFLAARARRDAVAFKPHQLTGFCCTSEENSPTRLLFTKCFL